jgi:hypothetical protein
MATTAKAEKVIFAEDAVTIHLLDGDVTENPDGTLVEPVSGRVMLPGETVAIAEVPSYLRKLVEEGKAPGLSLLTPTQAARLVKQAEKSKASIRDLVADDDEEE